MSKLRIWHQEDKNQDFFFIYVIIGSEWGWRLRDPHVPLLLVQVKRTQNSKCFKHLRSRLFSDVTWWTWRQKGRMAPWAGVRLQIWGCLYSSMYFYFSCASGHSDRTRTLLYRLVWSSKGMILICREKKKISHPMINKISVRIEHKHVRTYMYCTRVPGINVSFLLL